MRAAQRDADAAKHDTHDFVWVAASWLPPVKTVRGITTAIDTLATQAAARLSSRSAPRCSPSVLRIAPNKIALAPLVAAAPDDAARGRRGIACAHAGRRPAERLVRADLDSTHQGPRRADLTRRARSMTSLVSPRRAGRCSACTATGATSSASRTTRRRGRPGASWRRTPSSPPTTAASTSSSTATTASCSRSASSKPVVQLGHAVHSTSTATTTRRRAGSRATSRRTSPTRGNIWAHLWEAQTGQHIDGVFGVDPVGLAELLGAVGPVTLPATRACSTARISRHSSSPRSTPRFPACTTRFARTSCRGSGPPSFSKLLSGSGDPAGDHDRSGSGGRRRPPRAVVSPRRRAATDRGTPLAGELSPTTGAVCVGQRQQRLRLQARLLPGPQADLCGRRLLVVAAVLDDHGGAQERRATARAA